MNETFVLNLLFIDALLTDLEERWGFNTKILSS